LVFEGLLRRLFRLVGKGAAAEVRQTWAESLVATQVESPFHERVRAARTSWAAFPPSGTITPVSGLPGPNGGQTLLWNTDSYRAYFLDEIGIVQPVQTTSGEESGVLWVAPVYGPTYSANTADAQALPVGGPSGGRLTVGGTGLKLLTFAVGGATSDLFSPNPIVWYPVAQSFAGVGIPSFGTAEHRSVGGGLVIPPQNGLCLYIQGTTAVTGSFFLRWTEVETDLE
jgi:hypothetical protein